MVVFPRTLVPLLVGRKNSLGAVQDALNSDQKIFLVTQKNPDEDDPRPENLYKVGVIAMVMQTLKLPDGSVKILAQAETRAELERVIEKPESGAAFVRPVAETSADSRENEALRRLVFDRFKEYSTHNMIVPEKALSTTGEIAEPDRFADNVAMYVLVRTALKQELLETYDVHARLERLIAILDEELEVLELKKRIEERVRGRAHKTQKDYFLREQMKAIEDELGVRGDERGEYAELRQKIIDAKMPPEIEKDALKELEKLARLMPGSPQAAVTLDYLETLVTVPWNIRTTDNLDIAAAQKILDEDHYGLDDPKRRIIEYLAVCKLTGKLKGQIICFVGPPGVGKTSLSRSIARAIGRKFVKNSLGGVHDEAEIRGHRRTYIGALPGRIIQSLIKAGSRNPVMLLDEIDKMGKDFRGDPSAALLEVLDPAENFSFSDHYLEVEFDLSEIMFITTANIESDIPYVLRDRLEVIRLSGYTEDEKINIARQYLIPRALENHGIPGTRLKFDHSALQKMIREYTREAGVRNIDREIANVCRKVARGIVSNSGARKYSITGNNVGRFLGVPNYSLQKLDAAENVGVVTGLAWTSAGGDIMAVEAAVMPGDGKLHLTGKLGEVMQESAQTALSHLRERAESIGLNSNFMKTRDIHVHVPEGAVPKDGPSAGISIAAAMYSALSGKKIDRRVALTGEITLRGKVLPIGGLKEKSLAAHREGLRVIIIPRGNKKNLEELPKKLRDEVKFILVDKFEDVLKHVLKSGERKG
jgi:ATP-dependent Lon protease